MLILEHVTQTRRSITLWLIAMMVFLSLATSIHSVTHLNDKSTDHCVLCVHQHQLQNALTSTAYHFHLARQRFVSVEFQAVSYSRPFTAYFNSRAPPITA
jgi:hypothetical protein